MIRGKSLPPEHVLEKIKSHNTFEFSKGFEKGYNVSFFKISLCRINSRIFYKKDKN